MATYDEYTQLFDQFGRHMHDTGAYRVIDFSLGTIRMWCFMNHQLFTIAKITDDSEQSNATIEFIGAGACGMTPSAELFRLLATPDENLAYGASFASVRSDETVLSGARLALPLAIFNREDANCTRFSFHTVERLGIYARQTAEELIPIFGGRLLDGEKEEDANNLFAAAAGH